MMFGCVAIKDFVPFQMVLMPGCPHSVCIECFKGHFTNVMKTQTVKHFNCPVCAQPDMTDPQIETYLMLLMPLVSETFAICVSDMFHGATQLFDKIKMHIDKEVYNLGQQKLIEYILSREPNFCWCANVSLTLLINNFIDVLHWQDKCHAGFTNETGREKIACPICKKEMCFKCKKPVCYHGNSTPYNGVCVSSGRGHMKD